jgi:hypothetical protein
MKGEGGNLNGDIQIRANGALDVPKYALIYPSFAVFSNIKEIRIFHLAPSPYQM